MCSLLQVDPVVCAFLILHSLFLMFNLIIGEMLPVAELQVGHILAVRAGEMIPCDGVVIKGDGVIDESSLTGESIPISKKKGDKVLSGTVMQNGYIEVRLPCSPFLQLVSFNISLLCSLK
jgi:P-type E1-E2 ATPase